MTNGKRTALILGAYSAIAEAFCRRLSAMGYELIIVGRRKDRLLALEKDFLARGASSVEIHLSDLVTDASRADELLSVWRRNKPGKLDVVAVCHGKLTAQETPLSVSAAANMLDTNFKSVALWSLAVTDHLDAKGKILILGSVAGDRGRRKNFWYGASKAGLTTLVQGINHAEPSGVTRAILIKPGLVDTPMTDSMAKESPLWSSADDIAEVMTASLRRNTEVVYAPWFWLPIMLVIKSLPRFLFRRLNI